MTLLLQGAGIQALSATPPSPVLPQVSSAILLLDLRASQLALSDNDRVSTWPDASGNSRNFTQSGDARPTYKASYEGAPAVYFAGADVAAQYMAGPNDFADNLTNFAVFLSAKFDGVTSWSADTISKNDIVPPDPDTGLEVGWRFEVTEEEISGTTTISGVAVNGTIAEVLGATTILHHPGFAVDTMEKIGADVLHTYISGDNTGETLSGSISNFANTAPVRIGTSVVDLPYSSWSGWIRAALIYQITDLVNWSTDRAAIEAWLATNP